jgi:gas vesicle protein
MPKTDAQVKAQIEKYEQKYKDEQDELDSSLENEAQKNITFAKKLKEDLSKDLFGQEQAINTVVNSMKNDIIDNKKAPKATYLYRTIRS